MIHFNGERFLGSYLDVIPKLQPRLTNMTTKDWLEIIGGFVTGASISTVITVRICKSKWQRTTSTNQTGNRAGGDIVGGDKNVRR